MFLVIIFLYLAEKRPNKYLLVVLVYFSITSSTAPMFDFKLGTNLSGFNLYPVDLFTITSLFAATFGSRLAFNEKPQRMSRFPKKIISFYFIGIAVGVVSWSLFYGLKTGVNSWREVLLSISLLNYGVQKRYQWSLKELRVLLIYPGLILAAITLIRFIQIGIGHSNGVDPLTGEILDRATSALGGFILLIAWLGAFYLLPSNSFYRILIMIFLGVEILLLQQRTVWVATVVASACMMLFRNGDFIKFQKRAFRVVGLSSIFFTVWLASRRIDRIANAANDQNTFDWRTNRWLESLKTTRSAHEWLFGSIFGPSPVTNLSVNTQVHFSHSAYVNQIEYLGLLGLVILFFLLGSSYFNLTKKTPLGNLGRILTISAIIFGITYQVPVVFFVLIPIILNIQFTQEIRGSSIDSKNPSNKVSHKITRENMDA